MCYINDVALNIYTMNQKKETTPLASNPWIKKIAFHLGAYIILMVVAMLYFKPIAFDGKSLRQNDNIQSSLSQTEITEYREAGEGEIMWTNQTFGGMPTSVVRNHNVNYIESFITNPLTFFNTHNAWVTLFFIMLCAYLGLSLLGINFGISLGLSAALGFFTSNTLYLEAGHSGKMVVIATIPLIIGAFIYGYRKRPLLGAAIFGLGLSQNLAHNHPQMTYYMLLGLTLMGVGFLFDAVKQNKLPHLIKFTTAMFVAGVLAIVSNAGLLWPIYEYTQESSRGRSELTAAAENKEGLPKDYVFGMSMQKSEIGMVMFPNFYGGTQGESFYSDKGSATQKAFNSPTVRQELSMVGKKMGVTTEQQQQQFLTQIIRQHTLHYRGDQTIVGGPMYYGIVICFLLFLSLLLVRGYLKWGIVAAMTLFIALAWGKHFPTFNFLMYDYFPLYNKFRDTKMTLLVAQPLIILTIGLGLQQLINFDKTYYSSTWAGKLLTKLKREVSAQNYVLMGGAIALGITIITYLYLATTTLTTAADEQLAQISPTLLNAIQQDRSDLAKADIGKGIGFILIALVPLLLYTRKILPIEIAALLVAAIACIDLNIVNKEYLGEDDYVVKNYKDASKQIINNPTPADKRIMQDKDLYYHVIDYSRGYPSQSAGASAFHKSMGGYFAAKPMLYQEFWSSYQMDNFNVAAQQRANIMDMLNVKYVISPQGQVLDRPTTLGNAWFVEKINIVPNADAELQAVNNFSPGLEAVVQEKHKDYVQGLSVGHTQGDNIFLKSYHPEELVYEYTSAKDRFAVFSDMYYPPSKGWNVYINDQLVEPFVKTDYLIRGLKVPAASSGTIRMKFEPKSILVGRTIGGISSIIIILLTLFFAYSAIKDKDEVLAD